MPLSLGAFSSSGLASRTGHEDHMRKWVPHQFLRWKVWASVTAGRAQARQRGEELIMSPLYCSGVPML